MPTVLVADDEMHITSLLAQRLTRAGHEVITAEDGREALEMCLADRPDLLVTDYRMPHLTGLDLVRALRADARTRDLPVIMLTAAEFDVDPDAVEALGISVLASKPFSPNELVRTVGEVLEPPTPDPAPPAGTTRPR